MKYKVEITETLYYRSYEVEAQSEQEAKEKAQQDFDNGNIEVNESEITKFDVKKIP